MMNPIETVVKKIGPVYLKTRAKSMTSSREELTLRQEENFQKLKSNLKGTIIYKDLGLGFIDSYNDLIDNVTTKSYDDYIKYVGPIAEGKTGVLFNDPIQYMGLSSGTSGKDSKRIPYNDRMLKFFGDGQKRVASQLSLLEPEINFMEAKRLTFGSDPLVYTEGQIKYGYISGILGSRTPNFFKKNTFPSEKILNMTNWDEKINALIDESIKENIQIASGIPTYLISIFEAVLQKTGKSTINQIWPNLKVFIYAATPIKQYQERLDELVGHPLNYYGLYAATEGILGIPAQKYDGRSQQYLLNPDLLYSFSPVENPKISLDISNVKLNTPYYLNISSENGFIQYSMKDVIQFVDDRKQMTFEFVGRKSTGMNLGAEKTSDDQILQTFLELKNQMNIDFKHFFLSPRLSEGKNSYLWTLFSPTQNVDIMKAQEIAELTMCSANPDYSDCREAQVIGPAKVQILSLEGLENYFKSNRSRGQFKMKTTFETERDFNQFIQGQFSQSNSTEALS